MRDLGPATVDDMICAFWDAEVHSMRFSEHYRNASAQLGFTVETLPYPLRKDVLRIVRGYGANQCLFTGFPSDVTWRRMDGGVKDFDALLYANYESWVSLSNGTRRVLDGAGGIGAVANENVANVRAVAERIRNGETFPDLVAVEKGERFVLMEGHTRATAYVVAEYAGLVKILVGSSPYLARWHFY